ncbi:MAG: DUF3108 domain-containing protein [Bacteroidota bacterium]
MLIYKKIRNRLLSISVFIISIIVFQLFCFNMAEAQCYHKNTSFKAGEKLYYNVFYKLGFINIKLADVVLWVEESTYHNKNVFVFKNKTVSVPKYEWIIKVNDHYASYVDKNTMKVYKHVQKTVVDDYFTDYEYYFDHPENKLYASIENSKTKRYLDTLDLNSCLHDLLSACYYPRNIDYSKLKVNEKIFLPVVLNTDIKKIHYRYLGKETISIKKNRKLKCIKIAPLLVQTSIYKAGEKMTVWLSDDKNRVPVLMESDLWVGKISVQPTGYEGLLYQAEY